MQLRFVIGTLALVMLASPGISLAQNDSDTSTHTLTGCLKEGTKANVFSLTDEDGKMWELRSKTVQLSAHVNHKVTVTGKVPPKPKGNGNGSSDDAPAENRLRVTSLKMVNDSCTQP